MARTFAYGDPSYDDITASMVVVLSLTARQELTIEPFDTDEINGADRDGMFSWFSGYLVYAL